MHDPSERDLPPALREQFAELWNPGQPPERVREHLRAAAERQLAPLPRRVRRPVLLRMLPAAAAALLALVLWTGTRPNPKDQDTASLAPADINGDRVVNILDALDLARKLDEPQAAGNSLPLRWDINRDGLVDGADVDATARQAVRIDR
jgi:Dockerin type I domain